MRVLVAITALVCAVPGYAQVRPPVEGGRAQSLGQPATWKGSGTIAFGHRDGPLTYAALGLQHDLVNPMLSAFAMHGEAYVSGWEGEVDSGVRARLLSPFLRIGVGADYSIREGRADLLLSLFHPVRRGGVFRDGTLLRLDYLGGRDHAFTVGLEKPIRRNSHMGTSRPAHDHMTLPARGSMPMGVILSPHVTEPLDRARAAAARVRVTTFPLGAAPSKPDERDVARELESLLRTDAAASDGVLDYHEAIDDAFAAASSGAASDAAAGRAISVGARDILLRHVLLPYNSLLGQVKRRDSVHGLGRDAHAMFLRWLHLHAGVPEDQHTTLMQVFDELIDMVEENRAALREQWRDSRFVWLPLQYALRPDQHDTQAELDALIELATGTGFTHGNFVSYVVNEQFQYQLSRTIQEAEDYHVLWTHDFRGLDAQGNPDEMSYRHVLRSYLAALTRRVREYDRTARFPAYIIILDQWFYEVNRGRLWLTLLENPLDHELRLPPGFEAWQDTIAAAQEELRDAVAGSRLLQEQKRLYGDAWLRDLVKVHVNITNPADPSFWSMRVVRMVPLPDNMMRDHRKVVFYDITEEDPYRGAALFTGAGIGEHYANLSWEDRSLLVRGPAALPLKDAARELLIRQGIAPGRIPHGLLVRPRAPEYDERVRTAAQRNQQPLRALQVHNGAGFADKDVNIAKAVLYTLMPPGSVMKIPDSLWSGELWGSAVLGSALRGVRVLVIAPAAANAPADAFGSVGRIRQLLARLLAARQLLGPRIDAAGGMLRIGLYSSELTVTDIPAKVRDVQNAMNSHPWLRELFSFPESVLEGNAQLVSEMADKSMTPQPIDEFEYDPRPKLHLKANFFASPEAWSLMSRSEWSQASWSYTMIRIAQVQARSSAVASFEKFPDAIADVGTGMVQDWYSGLDEPTRERVVFYTLMGSHNQNNRSMVIDAEVGFLIAHWPAIIPYMDLISLIGQTRWIDTAAELDGLLPRDTGWKRSMAHWFRLAM